MAITGRNLRLQKFPFPSKFMSYLIENANAKIIQKFHRCCKQLYQVAPYFIVDSIECYTPIYRFTNEQYDACLAFINEDEFESFIYKISKIWVTKTVETADVWSIIRSDVTEISALGIQFPFEALKLLAKSGNVESLEWGAIFSPLEDILALVPKATSISNKFGSCRVTRKTMKKLLEIPWKNKIKKFHLGKIIQGAGLLDMKLFYKFVKVKNIILSRRISIYTACV